MGLGRLVVALAAVTLAVGCPDDGLLAEGLSGGRVDVGFFRVDSGPDAGPPRDARPPTEPDAGPDRDAAAPDADPVLRCECPAVPTSCPVVRAGRPVFAPSPDYALARQLFDVFACADDYLHIAIYESDWDCIVDALLARLAADLDLRGEMVIDDDQCPADGSGVRLCALARLVGHPRVSIIDDARTRYMHHKFVIADGRMMWTGSANFTRVSYCGELNDGLLLDDRGVIGAYEAEFQRLYTAREFGPRPRAPAFSSGEYTLYFGPETPITMAAQWFQDLVTAVDTASTSIAVMTSAWTRTEVSDALIRASQRGVDVRALVPPHYQDEPPAQALIAAGLPVRVGRVHYKVLLVDDRLVITGSPNWSENAWANNEASVWIRSTTVAADYRAHFEATFAGGRPPR